jgi:hypothetical protein
MSQNHPHPSAHRALDERPVALVELGAHHLDTVRIGAALRQGDRKDKRAMPPTINLLGRRQQRGEAKIPLVALGEIAMPDLLTVLELQGFGSTPR